MSGPGRSGGRSALLKVLAVIVVIAAASATGWAAGAPRAPASPPPFGPAGGEPPKTAKAKPFKPGKPQYFPTRDRKALDFAGSMSTERKVAQLFLFGFSGRDASSPVFGRLRRLDVGGLVFTRGNYEGAEELGPLAGEAAVVARESGHTRPWVLAAQEGGRFNAFPDLPPAAAPSALDSPADGGREAAASARALREHSVDGVLGPVLDIGRPGDPAVGPRAFSGDRAQVDAYAEQTVRAYDRGGVMAAVEHFPGIGSASQATNDGPANVGLSLETLQRRDLRPFVAAARAGAAAVVIGHGLYSIDDFVTPASLSRNVSTELLRERLGFRGLAISDDLAEPAVTALEPVPRAAVDSVRAGVDMVQISGPEGDQQAAYDAVLAAVKSGRIPRARLDEAVGRIVATKRRFGLVP